MFGQVKLYIYGAILLALIGLSATAYIYYLRYENVAQKYEQVLEINKENTRKLKELKEDWAAERVETEKELAAAQKRATAIDTAKEELENVPGAQDPVSPFFDELGNRLRSLGSGATDQLRDTTRDLPALSH